MVWTEDDTNSKTANPQIVSTATASFIEYDKMNVFLGKLGKERLLMQLVINETDALPSKKELVVLPRVNQKQEKDIYDSDVYIVKQVMIDYVHHEYNIFVELYDWED